MTTFDTVSPEEYQIFISWTPPVFKPIRYIHTVSCKLLCDPTTYYLSESETSRIYHSTVISVLQPGSVCLVKLLAEYNPASVDYGIGLSAQTLFSGKGQMINLDK